MPMQKSVELFGSFEALLIKLHADPEFETVETRLRGEAHNSHDDRASKVAAAGIDKSQE